MERISPEQALEKMNEGYLYLDVRSTQEFEAGHPQGAYNIPLLHMTPEGMQPNPDFMRVVEANFPKEQKLVLGCKAGGRSLRAAQMLEAAGYRDILDQRAGYIGAADASGQIVEQGWSKRNLPIATQAESGRSYGDLSQRA